MNAACFFEDKWTIKKPNQQKQLIGYDLVFKCRSKIFKPSVKYQDDNNNRDHSNEQQVRRLSQRNDAGNGFQKSCSSLNA